MRGTVGTLLLFVFVAAFVYFVYLVSQKNKAYQTTPPSTQTITYIPVQTYEPRYLYDWPWGVQTRPSRYPVYPHVPHKPGPSHPPPQPPPPAPVPPSPPPPPAPAPAPAPPAPEPFAFSQYEMNAI